MFFRLVCFILLLSSSNISFAEDDAELIKLRIKELELKKEVLELEAQQSKRSKAPQAQQLYEPPASNSSSEYIRGPRGGCYTYTKSGNKRYIPRSLCN